MDIAGAMLEKVTGGKLGVSLMGTWCFFLSRSESMRHLTGRQPTIRSSPGGTFKARRVRLHDPHNSYHLPACLAPGGGLSMSIEDYAKFLRLHLQGLRGHDGLLRAKTIQYLHAKPAGADENSIGFAFGWGLVAYEEGPLKLV